MRLPLIVLVLLCGCAGQSNPFAPPLSEGAAGIGSAADSQRRGQVELIVKSDFEAIKNDIRAGGGPVLSQAMDAAGVPASDRPARIIQLQSDMGLHANAPGPLVTALLVYGR